MWRKDVSPLVFAEKEVFAVFHKNLEMLATGHGTDPALLDFSVLSLIYPLLVAFGIIPVDREAYSIRRKGECLGAITCSCCGRRGYPGSHLSRFSNILLRD